MISVFHSLISRLRVTKSVQEQSNTHGDEKVFVEYPPFTLSMRMRKHQEEEGKRYNIKKKNYKWTRF